MSRFRRWLPSPGGRLCPFARGGFLHCETKLGIVRKVLLGEIGIQWWLGRLGFGFRLRLGGLGELLTRFLGWLGLWGWLIGGHSV